jgi:cytochrome c-type biogenesis protein CcmE
LKKSKLIAIVGIIASISLITVLLIINTRPYLQVSQVYLNPSEYDNREIQIIGNVRGYSGGNFNLTENEYHILIDISEIIPPSGLENDLQVVVTGRFNSTSLILIASQILTQCS